MSHVFPYLIASLSVFFYFLFLSVFLVGFSRWGRWCSHVLVRNKCLAGSYKFGLCVMFGYVEERNLFAKVVYSVCKVGMEFIGHSNNSWRARVDPTISWELKRSWRASWKVKSIVIENQNEVIFHYLFENFVD